MRGVRTRLAVLTSLTLASLVAVVPLAPAVPVAAVDAPDEVRAAAPDKPDVPKSIFAPSAIGFVLEANGNEVPRNGEEMMRALAKLGDFVQLPVAFSAVDLQSGLQKPRVVITQKPSFLPVPEPQKPNPNDPFPALPTFPGGPTPPPVQAPINNSNTLTKPNLEGRLFLAANMERKNGELKVKTFEFISWNSRKQKFDFGFIECDPVEPQIRLVDGVKCFSCHKNKGPILGIGPWSNTPHNDMVRAAMSGVNLPKGVRPQFAFDGDLGQPRRLDSGIVSLGNGGVGVRPKPTTADGMALMLPQGPAVDASVRFGAELARDRDVYRAMARNADGRKGLVVLMAAIAAPGTLEQVNQQARVALDQAFVSGYPVFADKWVSIHKSSTNTLIDFNPSGSSGSLQTVTTGSPATGGWGGGSTLRSELKIVWTGDPKQVTDYDAKRSAGEPGLPSARQPSNPRAFVKPTAPLPGKPSNAVNTTGLARLIGLTEGDRKYLADSLKFAAQQIGKPRVTAASVAREVFSGAAFSEVLQAGEIPDREDFKDRFVRGLGAVMQAHGADPFAPARASYASGPNVSAKPGEVEKEIPVVATTACVRCHDTPKTAKAGFSPIPVLAFDPFDKQARETWAKTTDATKRAQVLTRFLKRVAEDRDMPPEDSAEYEAFRAKSPAAMDAMKEWIEAELKRAKGN
ncbi:MAG: hypothetical protein FJ304_09340 [Planctomycetes bacterium]|nr:hypothetical protein [Planctomycetota bacterium]